MTQGIVVIVVYLQRIDANQTTPKTGLCVPEIAAAAAVDAGSSRACCFYESASDDIFRRILAS